MQLTNADLDLLASDAATHVPSKPALPIKTETSRLNLARAPMPMTGECWFRREDLRKCGVRRGENGATASQRTLRNRDVRSVWICAVNCAFSPLAGNLPSTESQQRSPTLG